jgi:hypothetical protein
MPKLIQTSMFIAENKLVQNLILFTKKITLGYSFAKIAKVLYVLTVITLPIGLSPVNSFKNNSKKL